jgi:peptidoglycan/LPS O-acetylase OafA/YrhL
VSNPAPVAAQAPRHLDALTGIRGVAAWLVVFYHIRISLSALFPAEAIAVFAKGYLAVDLFFVLSGFVLWYNYGERLRGGGIGGSAAFMWKRFARIWPLHAVILAAFVAFAVLLALTGRHSPEKYPVAELPLHLLLVQNWGFTDTLTWNHPAWSISTELAAYLLFPLMVLVLRWDRMPRALLLVAATAILAAIHTLFARSGRDILGADIPAMGLWRCLLEFTLGTVTCVIWQRWREAPAAVLVAGSAFALLLASGLAAGLPETAFVPAVFMTGILALAFDKGPVSRALSGRVAMYLGEISYSTYLAHFLLWRVYKIAFLDQSLQLGWMGLAGFFVLLFVVSAALYHGVEKPAQRWLNRHRPDRLFAARPVPAE